MHFTSICITAITVYVTMYKFLILIYLFGAVKPQAKIEWYNGDWVIAVEYPQEAWFPQCFNAHIQVNNDQKCSCDDEEVNAVNVMISPENKTEVTPIIIINTAAEVHDALGIQCKCDFKNKDQAAFRKINDNYFVLYVKHHSRDYANKAYLLLKKAPKLSELRTVMKSIDDLSLRQAGYLCEPNFFVNEFDNLD